MDLFYKSTRNSDLKVTASQAVLTGLAPDGGLFVPSCIPCLDVPLEKLGGMTYQETAFAVMKLFFTDFTEEELRSCIAKAYDEKFDTEEIAPPKNKYQIRSTLGSSPAITVSSLP